MGKRSSFARFERDAYDTPLSAVSPLRRHLPKHFTFCEPCAGRGALVDHLVALGGACTAAYDIAPRRAGIGTKDAGDLTLAALKGADFNITNTPWSRPVLHDLIVHLSDLRPSWLLIDADWIHTLQSIPYQRRLRRVQSIGRVKWIEGSKSTGKDNACWYLFDRPSNQPTLFYGRMPSSEVTQPRHSGTARPSSIKRPEIMPGGSACSVTLRSSWAQLWFPPGKRPGAGDAGPVRSKATASK